MPKSMHSLKVYSTMQLRTDLFFFFILDFHNVSAHNVQYTDALACMI